MHLPPLPAMIVGDLNADLSDLSAIEDLFGKSWMDIGGNSGFCGGIDAQNPCQAPGHKFIS